MGLLDRIKKVFDTGGIRVDLEAPKKFDWGDPTIPVSVTLTGHESESRSIQHLRFSLKDDGDNQAVPGMSTNDRPSRGDGRRFSATYVHLLALELSPGESHTFDIDLPLATNGGPGLVNRMSFTSSGATLHFGDQWYVLSVSAPVDGATMARADQVRLKASGRLGERHVQVS